MLKIQFTLDQCLLYRPYICTDISLYKVWFQNRRAKWRKSERFTQRTPSSKDDGENVDDVRSENEADDPDVCGDVSDTNEGVDDTKDGECGTQDKISEVETVQNTETETPAEVAKDVENVHKPLNVPLSEPPASSEMATKLNISDKSLDEDDRILEGKRNSPDKHLIHSFVSPENNSEQDLKTSRSVPLPDEVTSSMTSSSSTPPPPLTSLALVNSARASMLMGSKPMLQQSFTQTLMALSNNAMNRPSFFPMLDR